MRGRLSVVYEPVRDYPHIVAKDRRQRQASPDLRGPDEHALAPWDLE